MATEAAAAAAATTADLTSALEAIQETIATKPQIILSLAAPTAADQIAVREVKPFLLVSGAIDRDGHVVRSVDILVGFYAQRDVAFKVYYGQVLCEFEMKAGSFVFAFDKRSPIPLCAMVFNDVKVIFSDNSSAADSITVVGALLQPKLKYTLIINPSVWGGVGRTAVVKHGSIGF
jgi:hypothetical protein